MNSNVLTIGVGYDKVESTAWHTLIHSIMAKSTRPLAFIPIKRKNLISIYTRPRDPKQSNDFSFTRFLLPYLCGYQGQSLFMDCDMLVRTDITELFDLFDKQYAVQVVKHDYSPSDQVKYLGTVRFKNPQELTKLLIRIGLAPDFPKEIVVQLMNVSSIWISYTQEACKRLFDSLSVYIFTDGNTCIFAPPSAIRWNTIFRKAKPDGKTTGQRTKLFTRKITRANPNSTPLTCFHTLQGLVFTSDIHSGT